MEKQHGMPRDKKKRLLTGLGCMVFAFLSMAATVLIVSNKERLVIKEFLARLEAGEETVHFLGMPTMTLIARETKEGILTITEKRWPLRIYLPLLVGLLVMVLSFALITLYRIWRSRQVQQTGKLS